MRILVAEDEPLVAQAIKIKLVREGYIVTCCSNGKDAWNMIEEQMPDLVIADILMPFSSGLELTNKIKNGHLRNTSVIILSSLNQESVIVEAFKMGADDFIAKPFSFAELSIRIGKLIKQKKLEHLLVAV